MLDVVVCTICGVMHIELSQFIIEYLVRRGFISNGEFSFFVLLVSYFRAVSKRSCNWLNWTELLKHCVSPDSLLQCNMETILQHQAQKFLSLNGFHRLKGLYILFYLEFY